MLLQTHNLHWLVPVREISEKKAVLKGSVFHAIDILQRECRQTGLITGNCLKQGIIAIQWELQFLKIELPFCYHVLRQHCSLSVTTATTLSVSLCFYIQLSPSSQICRFVSGVLHRKTS